MEIQWAQQPFQLPREKGFRSLSAMPLHTLASARRRCIFGLSESRFHLRVMGRNIRFLRSELEPFRATFKQEVVEWQDQ
jgi:hypothetical protein